MIRRRFSNAGSETYMTIEAITETSIILPRNSWYSFDGYTWNKGTSYIAINAGHSLYIKDNVNAEYGQIKINGRCNLSGNCMSLIYGDDFRNNWEVPKYAFYYTFANNVGIEKVSKGFLPATTLADRCYSYMFDGCTSLVTAPELPATTLAEYCYYSMFSGCTSLTTAPTLPATTLVSHCYNSMFYNCKKLNYIKALFTTTPSSSYTSNWVSGVASSGTFVKNKNATWDVTGVNGVPEGWTIIKE